MSICPVDGLQEPGTTRDRHATRGGGAPCTYRNGKAQPSSLLGAPVLPCVEAHPLCCWRSQGREPMGSGAALEAFGEAWVRELRNPITDPILCTAERGVQ